MRLNWIKDGENYICKTEAGIYEIKKSVFKELYKLFFNGLQYGFTHLEGCKKYAQEHYNKMIRGGK